MENKVLGPGLSGERSGKKTNTRVLIQWTLGVLLRPAYKRSPPHTPPHAPPSRTLSTEATALVLFQKSYIRECFKNSVMIFMIILVLNRCNWPGLVERTEFII